MLYMKNNKLAVLVVILFSHFAARAQKIDSALNVLLAEHPVEKIYLQYDKEYYVAGETIWFKAYLQSDGKPSNLSNNFYLQFADSKGQVVSTHKFPIMGAVVKGNINIPDSLPQGNYYIRALTPHMFNYDEAFIYTRNLFIFKPGSVAAAGAETKNLSLQFFPESGHLTDGILSVVGFKATDQWGIPAEIEGIIKSDDGTTIASFKSFHDGMGRIQFKPQAGKKYVAEVETAAGKRSYPLPLVESSGISLKMQDEKGGKKFQLSRTAKEKERFDILILVAQINNHIVYENEIAFEDYPSIVGHLLTDSLPSGILHFTVFNKDRMPLAERLSFIDNGEYKGMATIADVKLSFEKRAANSMEVVFPEAIQRSCAVSVTDVSGQAFADQENIYSRFLLTSDLKGYVYNPAWYFENHNDSVHLAMDNLMLTHGWSRFSWTKILANQYPAKKHEDRGLFSISGKVVDPKTQVPLSYGKVGFLVEAEDSTSQTIEGMLDAAGRFKLDSVAFFGKAQLFYGYTDKNEKQKPALVILDENKLENDIRVVPADIMQWAAAKNVMPLQNKDEIALRYQQGKVKLEEVKELENVNVNASSSKKPIDAVNEKYTTGVFRGTAKESIDNINEPVNDRSINVIDFIKNRIQQVDFTGNNFVNRKNFSLLTGQRWLVGTFLNEQPVDIFMLRTLRAVDIALVKFFDAGFVGAGSAFPGGAISVYTRDRFTEQQKPDKLEFVEYNGYSIQKQFYSPDYSVPGAKSQQRDNRTTLYWNPDIFTDTETKSVKLNFYNNDFSKKYKVIVEGFDAAGKLIHAEKVIGN
jgi:hypothetical protein